MNRQFKTVAKKEKEGRKQASKQTVPNFKAELLAQKTRIGKNSISWLLTPQAASVSEDPGILHLMTEPKSKSSVIPNNPKLQGESS